MSTYGPEFFRNYIDVLNEVAPTSGKIDDFGDADGDGIPDIQKRIEKTRQTAIAAGFKKPDGSADTKAYFKSIADKQDAATADATAKYFAKPLPKEKHGYATWTAPPPDQPTPALQATAQKKFDAAWNKETQAMKDKMKAEPGKPTGLKFGPPGPRPIQATPTADDPKVYIRTKPMPRPWRKDQEPLPMGDVAVQYNKDNPKAAKSREQQKQIKQMARDEAGIT